MTAKTSITLPQIFDLISSGQASQKDRWEDMRADIDQKHKENSERRHAQGNRLDVIDGRQTLIEGRVAVVETKLTTVVGDNSGGTGLLHEIDRKVDSLKDEVGLIKQTVQDTPKINKYIYGIMAVLGFLAIVVPIGLTILFGMLEIIFRFWKH